MRGVDGIHTEHVPCVNGVNSFNLDHYMEKDHSRAKIKATAWGNGDFKALIQMNDKRHQTPTVTPVIKPITKPQSYITTSPKVEEATMDSQEQKKHKVGYRERKIELSDIGKRINGLLIANNTNVKSVCNSLHMKPDTLVRAMKPSPKSHMVTYKAIARYFKVDLKWLLEGDIS